jgi:hypothetical protein
VRSVASIVILNCSSLLIALSLTALSASAAPAPTTRPTENLATPTAWNYDTRTINGWTVHIDRRLLETENDKTSHMIERLTERLANIAQVVPAPAVTALRNVDLWVSPQYPGVSPRSEYHPGADWLKKNGRNPAMVKGVEFTNVSHFDEDLARMPMLVLHELAHAYHDQVLGFDQPEIIACYKQAVANKSYDAVDRFNGPGRPMSKERAYAMTNEREYFAESTEAFFGRNDFFPFTRSDLAAADPDMCKLLDRLWSLPAAGK